MIQNDRKNLDGFLYQKKVEQYLHTAISEDRFELYYQPVYSIAEKRFITPEALSRLHHPELGWSRRCLYPDRGKDHMIEQITDLRSGASAGHEGKLQPALSRLWMLR